LREVLEGWLAALLPLHQTPGTVNELASLLSVFHEQLVQCLFTLCGPALSAHVAGGAAGVVQRVLASVADAWEETKRGNSTKAVLLLHEVDQLLQFVQRSRDAEAACGSEGGRERSGTRIAASGAGCSAVAQFLPLVLPMLCEAVESDNSRVAQVGLGLFKQDAFVDALLPPGPTDFDATVAAACFSATASTALSGGEGSGTAGTTAGTAAAAPPAPAAAAAAGTAVASAPMSALQQDTLRRLLRALHRGGDTHWNVTVNKLTHTVLGRLLDRNAPAVRAAFATMYAPPTAPLTTAWGSDKGSYLATTMEARAVAPSGAQMGAACAGIRSGSELGQQMEVDDDGFTRPPPRAAARVPAATAGSIMAVAEGRLSAACEGASGVPRAAAAHGSDSGGEISVTKNAHRAAPPTTVTGVAPWAQPSIGSGMQAGPIGAFAGRSPAGGGMPHSAGPVNPRAGGAAVPLSRGAGAASGLAAGGGKAAPPLTVTGVAPWAVSARHGGGSAHPPLTVTGVAPWAIAGGVGGRPAAAGPRVPAGVRLLPSVFAAPSAAELEEDADAALLVADVVTTAALQSLGGCTLCRTRILRLAARS
jgi:hypothetical protein